MNPRIGAIVLAAGFSTRFDGMKLCAKLANGKTVFSQTLQNIITAIPNIIIVTRPEVAKLLSVKAGTDSSLHIFKGAESGMGSSLSYGIQQIKDWDACLVCLADMPFILPSTYSTLASSLTSERIVIPNYRAKPGNPVGFGKKFFPELIALTGDSGGKKIAFDNPVYLYEVAVNDPAILIDIDTVADLEKFSAS
jgi:molybdenum cofactor cytidylyltransferase|tara:strand:- start:264 stop:845 length:582 start_codon:yes stop_codon:yes gene_type:complete